MSCLLLSNAHLTTERNKSNTNQDIQKRKLLLGRAFTPDFCRIMANQGVNDSKTRDCTPGTYLHVFALNYNREYQLLNGVCVI